MWTCEENFEQNLKYAADLVPFYKWKTSELNPNLQFAKIHLHLHSHLPVTMMLFNNFALQESVVEIRVVYQME